MFRIVLLISLCTLFACSPHPKNDDPVVTEMRLGQYPDSAGAYQQYINQNYQVFSMPIPEDLNFAGEQVPLDKMQVTERLDREVLVNTYWHSNTFLHLKRSFKWFPMIERIIKKHNLPNDLKYVALIESGLINVVSPAGATGFWQFMKATGQGYGLEINQYVDERYHIEKATHAACKYLKGAHKKFGSWSLAAASYNMGMGGVNKALSKQKVDSYYDLHLNDETARYVYRILSAKLILSNFENYGFRLRKRDYYRTVKTKTYKVQEPIEDLVEYAQSKGSNYHQLRTLNPWLRDYKLPIKEGKTYYIKLPPAPEGFVYQKDTNSSVNRDSI